MIIRSSNLQHMDVRATGLYDAGEFGFLFFLYTGIISAHFQDSGMRPWASDFLKMMVNGVVMWHPICFINLGGILSGPGDEWVFKFFIA